MNNGDSTQAYIVDDRTNKLFQVNRSVFTSAEVMAQEMRRVFDKCWLYAGHESEIPRPGDFRTRRVAGRPLILARGSDGQIRVLLNTCTHRGAMVCRHREGNAKTFQCFYHAWTFDNQGRLVGVPGEDAYGPGFDRAALGLGQPVQVDTYKGFIFISFNPQVEALADYLAGAKEYLDIAYDQGWPQGLEIVTGQQEYCMHANWKLLVENSIDGYHSGITHYRYFNELLPDLGIPVGNFGNRLAASNRGVGRALGKGHGCTEIKFFKAQIDEFRRAELEEHFGPEHGKRLIENTHNVFIFPNLILINIWRTVRTFYPIAPNQVEVNAWALMPKSDTIELRRERLDNFLSFLGPGGFATPDDAEGLEMCQRGFNAHDVGWSDISRGMNREQPYNTDELQMREFWRQWNELMTAPAA